MKYKSIDILKYYRLQRRFINLCVITKLEYSSTYTDSPKSLSLVVVSCGQLPDTRVLVFFFTKKKYYEKQNRVTIVKHTHEIKISIFT